MRKAKWVSIGSIDNGMNFSCCVSGGVPYVRYETYYDSHAGCVTLALLLFKMGARANDIRKAADEVAQMEADERKAKRKKP